MVDYSNIPFIFHSTNRDGCLIEVSMGWCNTLEYEHDLVIGKPLVDFMTPKSQELAATMYPLLWETGYCRDIHYEFLTSRGVKKDFLLNGVVDNSEQTFEFMSNISEIITYRNELIETKEMYRALSKASPVGIFRIDDNGHCEYVNDQWREWTMMSLEESVGNGWLKAIHPQDRTEFRKKWNLCIKNSEPFTHEFRLRSKNQDITWVLGQAKLAKCGGYVGTVTNITSEKQVLPKLIEIKQLCRGAQ